MPNRNKKAKFQLAFFYARGYLAVPVLFIANAQDLLEEHCLLFFRVSFVLALTLARNEVTTYYGHSSSQNGHLSAKVAVSKRARLFMVEKHNINGYLSK